MITGWNFGASRGTAKVFFGGTAATRYVSWSATKIRVKVPKLAEGRRPVRVVTSGGTSNAMIFRLI